MDTTNKPLTVEEAAKDYAENDDPMAKNKLGLYGAFKAGSQWQKEQGHIKWYSIEKDGLPVKPNDTGRFLSMLIFDEYRAYNGVDVSVYDFELHRFEKRGSIAEHRPTHYAFINYPE